MLINVFQLLLKLYVMLILIGLVLLILPHVQLQMLLLINMELKLVKLQLVQQEHALLDIGELLQEVTTYVIYVVQVLLELLHVHQQLQLELVQVVMY